jgi:hypothetical protein
VIAAMPVKDSFPMMLPRDRQLTDRAFRLDLSAGVSTSSDEIASDDDLSDTV